MADHSLASSTYASARSSRVSLSEGRDEVDALASPATARRDDDDDSLLGDKALRLRTYGLDDDGAIPASPRTPKFESYPQTPRRRPPETVAHFARAMAFQTVPMLLLSLLGSVLAGETLARLKTWRVFERLPELFVLVPIVLNLKNSIECNLAARFSTSANIGELDIRLTRRTLVLGNLALLQVQALVVSFVAGVLAFVLGLATRTGLVKSGTATAGSGGYFELLLVLCASMVSAAVSSAIAGSFMTSLVIVSRRLRLDPDNFATPLASSIGDLLTLTILGFFASAFFNVELSFVSTGVFIGLLAVIGINVFITVRNAYVQELLLAGWIPLFLALAISSGTGLVLESYVNAYRGFGLIAPVLTGIAGNVGAIFVSRISTALHASRQERYVLVAATLWIISTPILCSFLAFAYLTGQVGFSFWFTVTFCVTVGLMVALSLGLGYLLATILWRFNLDPDINALPILSSLIDVIGQGVLVLVFALTTSRVVPSAPLAPSISAVPSALGPSMYKF